MTQIVPPGCVYCDSLNNLLLSDIRCLPNDISKMITSYSCLHSIPNDVLYAVYDESLGDRYPLLFPNKFQGECPVECPKFLSDEFIDVCIWAPPIWGPRSFPIERKWLRFWLKLWQFSDTPEGGGLNYRMDFVSSLFPICSRDVIMQFLGLLLLSVFQSREDFEKNSQDETNNTLGDRCFSFISSIWAHELYVNEHDYTAPSLHNIREAKNFHVRVSSTPRDHGESQFVSYIAKEGVRFSLIFFEKTITEGEVRDRLRCLTEGMKERLLKYVL